MYLYTSISIHRYTSISIHRYTSICIANPSVYLYINIHLYIYTSISICISIPRYPSIHLSIYISIYVIPQAQSTCAHPQANIDGYGHIHLYSMSICISISIYPSIYLYIYLCRTTGSVHMRTSSSQSDTRQNSVPGRIYIYVA